MKIQLGFTDHPLVGAWKNDFEEKLAVEFVDFFNDRLMKIYI